MWILKRFIQVLFNEDPERLQPLRFRAGQPSYATVLPVKLPTPQGNGAGFEPAFCRWLVFYVRRSPWQPLARRVTDFYCLYMEPFEIAHLQALRQGIELLLKAHRAQCCPHTGIYELSASRLEGLVDALRQWCYATFLVNPVVEADEMCKGRVWLKVKIGGRLSTDVALNILP